MLATLKELYRDVKEYSAWLTKASIVLWLFVSVTSAFAEVWDTALFTFALAMVYLSLALEETRTGLQKKLIKTYEEREEIRKKENDLLNGLVARYGLETGALNRKIAELERKLTTNEGDNQTTG